MRKARLRDVVRLTKGRRAGRFQSGNQVFQFFLNGFCSRSQLSGLLVSSFQIGSITGAILIVLIAVVGGILYQSAWIIAPKLWIIGMLFPLAGYSLGFLLARIAGQSWHRYGVLINQTGNLLL